MAVFIDTVFIRDKNAEAIAALIDAVRPELKIVTDAAAIPSPDHSHYAVITFKPGSGINHFRGAKWIHCSGAGVDQLLASLDFQPALLTRTIGHMGRQIAEYVLTYYLSDLQNIAQRQRLQSAKLWEQDGAKPTEAYGQRALIFGTGKIGREIASYLSRLGIDCTGLSRSGALKPEFENCTSMDTMNSLESTKFDLIIGALPNHPDTKTVLNEAIFQKFQNALFINIGRGETVNEKDLLAAVNKAHLRGAVLDVFTTEPLPQTSPLWTHENIIITPHISGLTKPKDTADAFLNALKALENSKVPDLIVSIEKGY